jgi:hypothetical protein
MTAGGFAQKLLISREFLGKWPFVPKKNGRIYHHIFGAWLLYVGTHGHTTAKPCHNTEAKIGMFAMPRWLQTYI